MMTEGCLSLSVKNIYDILFLVEIIFTSYHELNLMTLICICEQEVLGSIFLTPSCITIPI